MKKGKETTIMAQNLDRLKDLMPDILLRLPVKSLRRFTCVNKSWYNLVKSPDFISKHLHTFNNPMNSTDPINLLVNRTRPATFGLNRKVFISLMSFNPTNNNASLTQLDLIYNRNETTHLAHLEILGPRNGLYCLHSFPILIVNPSMREFRILPDIPAPLKTYCLQRYNGFGFDPKTNDYKVVMIMDTWRLQTNERLPWHVKIYSLNSHCWRKVDCPFPHVFIWSQSWVDAFVHGLFHWWACDDAGGDIVLAFDMKKETFRTFRLPHVRSSAQGYAGTVAKFRGSLAVIVYPEWGTEKCFDLWVMEDYGNEGSWTMHSTIGPIAGARRPVGFLEEKNLFLLEDNNGRMVFYDLQTEEIMHAGFHGEEDSL